MFLCCFMKVLFSICVCVLLFLIIIFCACRVLFYLFRLLAVRDHVCFMAVLF